MHLHDLECFLLVVGPRQLLRKVVGKQLYSKKAFRSDMGLRNRGVWG